MRVTTPAIAPVSNASRSSPPQRHLPVRTFIATMTFVNQSRLPSHHLQSCSHHRKTAVQQGQHEGYNGDTLRMTSFVFSCSSTAPNPEVHGRAPAAIGSIDFFYMKNQSIKMISGLILIYGINIVSVR
jgi:hypothetical protein